MTARRLDTYHYHEAVDRCHVLNEILDDVLIKHPVVQKHAEVRKLLEDAADLIGDAYQKISQLADDFDKGGKP